MDRRNVLLQWHDFLAGLLSLMLDTSQKGYAEDSQEYGLAMEKMAELSDNFRLMTEDQELFDLEREERLAFYLVAACMLGEEVALLVASVQKDRGSKSENADISLVLLMLSLLLGGESYRPGLLLKESSFMNEFLIKPVKGELSMNSPLMLREGILSFLLDESYSLGMAEYCAREIRPAFEEQLDHLEEYKSLEKTYAAMAGMGEKGVIYLCGNEGIGKKFLATLLAQNLQCSLVVLDAEKLFCAPEADSELMVRRVIAKCCFEKALCYVDIKKQLPEEFLQRLMGMLGRFLDIVFAGCRLIPDESSLTGGSAHIIEVSVPQRNVQQKFWEYFAQKEGLIFDEDIRLGELVSVYDMSPERIHRAVLCARGQGEVSEEGFRVNASLLQAEIRKICQGRFTELARRISSPFTWEDLKASKETKDKMREAVNRIRYRSLVNEEYGFGKRLPYGQGLVIAFYGPPGTGKTMAANVMANELGLDIYRIDLSQISSKYIGESEKNLSAVFEAARYSNSILFFDEADALFAKRTGVSSSNDKHANSETAFLLQKMEEYSGISILATNAINNFDAAFKRRITYMIPVEQPDEAARLILWESVFPPQVPMDKNINFKGFAKLAELSGSGIKSAALRATYLAAARGEAVSGRDIAVAIDEEYQKLGHISILPQLMSQGAGRIL